MFFLLLYTIYHCLHGLRPYADDDDDDDTDDTDDDDDDDTDDTDDSAGVRILQKEEEYQEKEVEEEGIETNLENVSKKE
jgi:hypothetical protein